MKQPMKKLLSLVLASSMVLGMATTAQAAFQDFTDVKGHWAEATLQQAYEDGILKKPCKSYCRYSAASPPPRQ